MKFELLLDPRFALLRLVLTARLKFIVLLVKREQPFSHSRKKKKYVQSFVIPKSDCGHNVRICPFESRNRALFLTQKITSITNNW